MADGLFYNDLREPFVATDLTAISPLSTAVALYTPSSFPVLGGQYFSRIGKALNDVPGPVIIAGHTDNQPIRSLRFPSNWHLSKDRAASARAVLAGFVKPERLTAEGRADTEPVADNNSVEGRARNRRVEITLLATNPPAN